MISGNYISVGLLFFLMGLFDVGPGSNSLRPCPQCLEDKIKRTGILAPYEYTCTSCGYVADSDEVQKTVSETYRDSQKDEDGWEDIKNAYKEAKNEGKNKERQKIENVELREQVEERQIEGWSIDEIDNQNERVIMSHSKGGTIGGHAVTGILTGLWTFGAGNVAYQKLSQAKNKEKVVVKIQNNLEDDNNRPKDLEDLSNKIRTLKELYEDDIISEEEFNKKKKQILDKM